MASRRLPPDQPGRLRVRRKRDRTASHLDRPDNLLAWRIDWRDYFRRFVEAHGGNPLEIDGRLVFEDGWSYSATDYRGPERRPPAKPAELASLLLAYWQAFKAEAAGQLKQLRLVGEGLKEAAVLRSLPLTRKVAAGRDERGIARWENLVIDGDELRTRASWLEAKLAEAEEQIRKLKRTKDEAHTARP